MVVAVEIEMCTSARWRNDIYNSFMHNDIENICFGGGFHIFPYYYCHFRRRRFSQISITVEHLKVLNSRACLRILSMAALSLSVEYLKVLMVEHLKVMAALSVEPACIAPTVRTLVSLGGVSRETIV